MTSTTASSPELPGLARVGVIGGLLALAAGAWVLTGGRMGGMDAGPGTELGALGWFAVSWLLMMAAMMLPSLVPAALAFARTSDRTVAPFVTGYLAVWTAAGVVAYALFEALRSLDVAFVAWDRAGQYVAAGVILAAAAYQLTAAKARCLDRCRTPVGAIAGLRGGLRFGASCVGCCAGLMATLFALGVMSLTWMVAVAALIAAERLLPWRTPAVYGVATALAVLAIWMAVAPGDLPALTLPGSMDDSMPGSMQGK
jgi:predicted metal-binding membrane protein